MKKDIQDIQDLFKYYKATKSYKYNGWIIMTKLRTIAKERRCSLEKSAEYLLEKGVISKKN